MEHSKVGGSLWVITTRMCPLACKYCYQSASNHNYKYIKERGLTRNMDDNVAEATLEFMGYWAQGPDKTRIVWYGGEPTLNWPLMQRWIPEVYRVGYKQSVTTNGTLLSENRRKFLDKYDVGLLLSLDGPPWLHNKTRPMQGGAPSWDRIAPEELVKWRPELEIAWQLDPSNVPTPADLDWMRDKGFKRINFNINWLSEWSLDSQIALTDFMRYAVSLAIKSAQGRLDNDSFSTNWLVKLDTLLTRTERMEKPCGTGLGMIAVTPEGWLYTSQELAFTVFEPGKDPSVGEYYRVGSVLQRPYFYEDRVAAVANLRVEDMIVPSGFDCETCPAAMISLGGCHCKFVGEDPTDPSRRHHVLLGYCQSMRAAVTGLLQAAQIEHYITKKQQVSKANLSVMNCSDKLCNVNKIKDDHRPLSIVDLDHKLDRVITLLEKK